MAGSPRAGGEQVEGEGEGEGEEEVEEEAEGEPVVALSKLQCQYSSSL